MLWKPVIWELFEIPLTRSCPCFHTIQPVCRETTQPKLLSPLCYRCRPSPVLIPCPAHSSVNSANISPEWIPHHLISYRFGSVLRPLSPWLFPDPFCGRTEEKKNKVVWGSQMKGFEASEEKCVYLLSPVTSPSALWPSSLQASPGRFITALVLHICSFAEFCFLKIL